MSYRLKGKKGVEQLNSPYRLKNYDPNTAIKIKGSPVHAALACTGTKEGSDHFGSYVQSFPAFLQEAIFRT
jgi:hypothetical protein